MLLKTPAKNPSSRTSEDGAGSTVKDSKTRRKSRKSDAHEGEDFEKKKLVKEKSKKPRKANVEIEANAEIEESTEKHEKISTPGKKKKEKSKIVE